MPAGSISNHIVSLSSTNHQIEPIDNHKFQNVSTTAALSPTARVNKIYAPEQVVRFQHLNFHPAATLHHMERTLKKCVDVHIRAFYKAARGHKSCADSFKCSAAVVSRPAGRPTHGTVVACISFSKCVQGG
jgi:hypothetical protein